MRGSEGPEAQRGQWEAQRELFGAQRGLPEAEMGKLVTETGQLLKTSNVPTQGCLSLELEPIGPLSQPVLVSSQSD